MTNLEYNSGAIAPGECISGGWNLVTARFGMYLGIGLLTMLLIGCIPLVSVFLIGPVLAGFYYVALRDMRGDPVEFGMMFRGFENFVPLMVAGLIQSIPGIIITVVQYTVDFARLIEPRTVDRGDFFQARSADATLSGLSLWLVVVIIGLTLSAVVWQVALSFAIPLILERNLGVVDALTLSARAAVSNVGGLIVLVILECLLGLLGLFALCLGIFVAISVIYAANAFAYRQVFPLLNLPFDGAPPPMTYPGTYGANI